MQLDDVGGRGSAAPNSLKVRRAKPFRNQPRTAEAAAAGRAEDAMSHVDVKNLKPSSFEEEHFDEYEYYNLTDKYVEGSARKGRTKKEASENTNRPNPGGHERKIVEKLQNSEKKAKA
uniref:Nuclear protein 1b n=1 Tax=Oryzias latipes TaxID=8090 RepID=A0A3P9MNC5_ORYLA